MTTTRSRTLPTRRRIAAVGVLFAVLTAGLTAGLACRDDDRAGDDAVAPAGAPAAAPTPVEPVRVTAEATGLLFRYYDADARGMKTARSVADVPEAARARVIVHEERKLLDYRAGQPLTVADLRTPGDDGVFPAELVDPHVFGAALPAAERAARPAAAAPAPAKARAGDDRVILFSTDWCPHCRRARAFLERRGVPFVERNLEKDPKARPLLQKLGRQAGVDPALLTSVPILWVKGRLLLGFDEKQVAALL